MNGTRLIEQSNGTDTLHFNYDRNGEAIGFTHFYLSTGHDDPTMCEYIYVKNAQGDVVGIYNSLGDLKVSYTYDPWGKLLSVENGIFFIDHQCLVHNKIERKLQRDTLDRDMHSGSGRSISHSCIYQEILYRRQVNQHAQDKE